MIREIRRQAVKATATVLVCVGIPLVFVGLALCFTAWEIQAPSEETR